MPFPAALFQSKHAKFWQKKLRKKTHPSLSVHNILIQTTVDKIKKEILLTIKWCYLISHDKTGIRVNLQLCFATELQRISYSFFNVDFLQMKPAIFTKTIKNQLNNSNLIYKNDAVKRTHAAIWKIKKLIAFFECKWVVSINIW